MLIKSPDSITFNGKIIDAHVHTGRWDKPSGSNPTGTIPYCIEDIFERADKVQADGDEISKILISNLDCIKEENGNPILDEFHGNKKLLEDCKGNPRAAVLAVCQPKTGSVKNIEKLFNENPNSFAGLKFHPLNSNFNAADEKYLPYLKFAQKKYLPCLFHSLVNVDNIEGKLIKDQINVADPENIYKSARKTPKTPIILGHMGAGWNESHTKAIDVIIQSIEKNDANLYADISWVDFQDPKKPHLLDAIDRLLHTTKGDKTDRLLFGTDAPIAEYYKDSELYPKVVRETKAAIKDRFADKSEEIINKIFYKNADDIFFKNRIPDKQKISKTKIGLSMLAGIALIGSIAVLLKERLSKD